MRKAIVMPARAGISGWNGSLPALAGAAAFAGVTGRRP
jgi:hypothetical protein